MTRVVNVLHESCEVYVGRPSAFGNPFNVRRHSAVNRTEAIAKHEQWLKTQPALVTEIRRSLKGKVLGCFCKPKPCHADTLARVAEMTEQELTDWRGEPAASPMLLCLEFEEGPDPHESDDER